MSPRGRRGAGAPPTRRGGARRAAVALVAAGLTAVPAPAPAQAPPPVSPDGGGRIAFPLRDDVELCSDGGGRILRTRGDVRIRLGREEECGGGEGIAEIEMEAGRLRALRLRPPSPERGTDAVWLSGPDAARTFLGLARGAPTGEAGSDAVLAAVVARNAVVWPGLVDLARSDGVTLQTRKSAVFWVGQLAAEAAPGLVTLARADDQDREVRKAAVFALSRLDGGGRDALIEVARSDTDPEVRRAAFFWLAERADDEVLAFFEEVLGRGR